MLPAHPPLPTARNFPFQFSAGIHNSISMCESEDGANVAPTLQYAGRGATAVANSAAVTVTVGSERDFNPSHVICCWGTRATRSIAILIMIWSPEPNKKSQNAM